MQDHDKANHKRQNRSMAAMREKVTAALQDAVLALTAVDGTVGTGFFVAPGLVLTCAHVVGTPEGPVSARGRGGAQLELTPVAEWHLPSNDSGGPDLALLRAPAGRDRPVVCLAEPVDPGDELWGFGYPQGAYRGGESVTFRAAGPAYRQEGAVALHHVAYGKAGPGFSGGPVVNWRTGAVCGVLRFAYGLERGGIPGARLITVADIMAAYPFLDAPSAVTAARRPWLELLNDDQLHAGGWRCPGPTLRSYLQAMSAAARDHPIKPRGGPTPPLAEVYVRQQAVRGASSTGGGGEGTPDAGGVIEFPADATAPHSAGQGAYDGPLAAVPADAVLHGGQSAAIVGGPGSGKSSLARYLAAVLSDHWLGEPCGVPGEEPGLDLPAAVPVLLPARVLAADRPLADALCSAAREGLGTKLRAALPDEFFAQPPMSGVRWLLLADSVDEIVDEEIRRKTIAVAAGLWCDDDLMLLLTTRPLPQEEIRPKRGPPRR